MKTFPLVYNPLGQEKERAMTPFPIRACLRTIPVLVSKQVVGTHTHVTGRQNVAMCLHHSITNSKGPGLTRKATKSDFNKSTDLAVQEFQQEYKDMILSIKPWEPNSYGQVEGALPWDNPPDGTIYMLTTNTVTLPSFQTPHQQNLKYTDISGVIRRGEANQTKA